MVKIDFVPNDYIEQKQSGRTNFLYLVLFAAVMGGIGITFSIIKMRQKAVNSRLSAINSRMATAGKQIGQLEELKVKSKSMMKAMVVTAELIEPVPKSIILACITNNLPSGVSLLQFRLLSREIETAGNAQAKTAAGYSAKSVPKTPAADQPETTRTTETDIELEGIAPSDIEVAAYIANLNRSVLLSNVALVESKEYNIDNITFRAFKLKAMLKKEVALTREDIAEMRKNRQATI